MQRESSRQPTRETEKAVLSELESLVSSKQLPHKCRALGRDRIELDTLNPKCFDAFLDAFDIDSHLTLSIKVAETEAPLDYLSLQREQNKDVEEGVSLARNGREEDALKKYKAALDMDADCVDALVARGAALVKLGRLVPAVKDLERAVSLDPSDKNAQKYLQQARDALGQELQSRKSLLRGEFVMPADFDPRNAAPAAATHELYPLIPDLGHEDREMERHRTRHRSSKKTKKKRKRKKSHRSRGSSSESDSADTDSDASSRRTNSSQDGSHDDRERRNEMMAMDSDEVIDLATFGQLLELDDDEDDREFSASLLSNYFGQAHETLGKMRVSLAANDLAALGKQGHFLKGSSAAVGLRKVRNSCERMQLLGAHRTVDGRCVDEATALQEAARLISQIELECNEGRARMEAFYKTVFA